MDTNSDQFDALKTHVTEEQAKANIENMIGAVHVPVGIAGPVTVKGDFAKGDYRIPLATTEGALVASVNRGCKAIRLSGGAEVLILSAEQTRSILFTSDSIRKIKSFLSYVQNNKDHLKDIGKGDEPYITITDIVSYVVGHNVWLRIHADTTDAMGMNMITITSKKIGMHLQEKTDLRFIAESGNMCVDKKPAAMNLVNGRGKKVIASVKLTNDMIKEVLKTEADVLVDMNYRKNLLGSAASGSLGFNAHFANIIAALFIATGQDAAHVVDGSLGFTTVDQSKKGVTFSVTLADLQVGTVGGGTGLPSQKACLDILGVAGPGDPPGSNAKKLAEIAATAVLAGEISLLAALCSKDLAKAHEELNR